jgi:flavodoxin
MSYIISRREAMFAIAGIVAMLSTSLHGRTRRADAVSSATEPLHYPENPDADILITCASFHHYNTLKIANAISSSMKVQMINPAQLLSADLTKYKIVGFGSGIYHQTFHTSMLDLADKITNTGKYKAFLFSTSGVSRAFALKHKAVDFHTPMRNKLISKGFEILDEYNCAGWNTNSFLKIFGGLNRGKPTEDDLKNAREFVMRLNERT